MRSYLDGMLRYFEFSGRSTRRQYWLFWLVATLLTILALAADTNFFRYVPTSYEQLGMFTVFAAIIHIIPGITVTVRRLHDSDRSGWWYFIPLVPLIGAIILLVWMCWPPETINRFGPDPRDEGPYREPNRSTIPRQVRMGSDRAHRPLPLEDASVDQRFI